MVWPFKKKVETRSNGSSYLNQMMAARAALIEGREGVAEMTAAAQSCISLWEGGLSLADVSGTDLLPASTLALVGRSLALRGEFVALLRGQRLQVAAEWDVKTRDGFPVAYRLSIADSGGPLSVTALADEVVHVVTGASTQMPYVGNAPLRRASLSAGLLNAIEAALSDVYQAAPIGSAIVPLPEANVDDLTKVRADFRGKRGSVLVVEGVSQAVQAGQYQNMHQAPADLTPQLSRLEANETLRLARGAIESAFGVLPALANPSTTGPAIRECQRHLSQWTLAPLAKLVAAEMSAKLETEIKIDVMRATQSYDVGGRARAAAQIVEMQARAKEAGVDADVALRLVGWSD